MTDEPKTPDDAPEPQDGPSLPKAPDLGEFDDRLQRLRERAKHARTQHEGPAQKKAVHEAADAKGLGFGLTIAYTIIGMPLVGVAIGWVLDQRAGEGQTYVTIGVLAGSVVGLLAVLIQISRANRVL